MIGYIICDENVSQGKLSGKKELFNFDASSEMCSDASSLSTIATEFFDHWQHLRNTKEFHISM